MLLQYELGKLHVVIFYYWDNDPNRRFCMPVSAGHYNSWRERYNATCGGYRHGYRLRESDKEMKKQQDPIAEAILDYIVETAPETFEHKYEQLTSYVFAKAGGAKFMAIHWPPLGIDICTIKMPDTIPSDDYIENMTTDQMLVHNPKRKPLFVVINKNPSGTLVTALEAIEAFFNNEWTPHWPCKTCRMRMNGNIKV